MKLVVKSLNMWARPGRVLFDVRLDIGIPIVALVVLRSPDGVDAFCVAGTIFGFGGQVKLQRKQTAKNGNGKHVT